MCQRVDFPTTRLGSCPWIARLPTCTSSSTPYYRLSYWLYLYDAGPSLVCKHAPVGINKRPDVPLPLLHASRWLPVYRPAAPPWPPPDRPALVYLVSIPQSPCSSLACHHRSGTNKLQPDIFNLRCRCDIRKTVRVSSGWRWLVAAHQTPISGYGVHLAGAHRTPAGSTTCTNKPPAARCKGVHRA